MNNSRCRFKSAAAGYTLIEMVASMIVMGVILLACGSIVALATRATNDAGSRTSTQYQSADAAAQVTDDLNVALNFTQHTANAVTFTVPDRLGLGTPQQVVYSWAGTSGSPLTRQFNGGTATTLLANVKNFNLTYFPRLMGASLPTVQTVSFNSIASSLADSPIDATHFAAEYFAPSLPSGTSTFTLTKLRILMKSSGQAGLMTLRVTAPSSLSNPLTNVLSTTTVYESGFSTGYEYIDIPFTGLSGLDPSLTYCLVFSYGSGGGQVGVIETSTSALIVLSTSAWSVSTNGGTSWATASQVIGPLFYIFGTVP